MGDSKGGGNAVQDQSPEAIPDRFGFMFYQFLVSVYKIYCLCLHFFLLDLAPVNPHILCSHVFELETENIF